MKDTEIIIAKGSCMAAIIPLVTWSVVNVTADVNDIHLISLDTNREERRCVCQTFM